MRLGVGGGGRLARGGVSIGRGGLRGGIGVGPFSLSGGMRGSGIIGMFVSLIWNMMVLAFWFLTIVVVVLWSYVISPLVFDVFIPRWRAATTTGQRARLVAAFAVPITALLALGVVLTPDDSTPASTRSSSAQSPTAAVADASTAENGSCRVGMNLEDCEDLSGVSAGDRLRTIDCSPADRSVMWASNWWIIEIRNGVLVVSKSSDSCD